MRRFCVVVLSAVVLAGCSSGSGGGPGPLSGGTALSRALGTVSDNPTTRAYVEFSTPAAAYKQSGGKLDNVYGEWGLMGAADLANYAQILPGTLGVDLNTAQTAVTAGNPPASTIALTGLSTDGLAAKLTDLGATKDPDGTYRFAADHQIPQQAMSSTDGKLQFLLAMNVVRIDGERVLAGRAAGDLANVSGSGRSLADNGDYSAVASCLGDPFAAVLTDTIPGSRRQTPEQQAGAPQPTAGVKALGIGVSGTEERICVRTDSDADAQQTADTVKQQLTTGSSQATLEKWSELIPGATVNPEGSVVRISYPAKASGYSAIKGLIQGDLPGLYGKAD